MNDKKLLRTIKADYKNAEYIKLENDDKVSKWKSIINSEKYGTEVANKSAYVSNLTKKLLNWQIPSIVDTLTNNKDLITCSPFTHADYALAEQDQTVLTYYFLQLDNYYEFIVDLVTLISQEGTCFVKTGWEYEEKEIECDMEVMEPNPITGEPEVIGYKTVKKTIITKNKPVKEICDVDDIRVDPTCNGDITKANFVIHTFETDLSTLRKDGRYKNLDKIDLESVDDSDFAAKRNADTGNFYFQDKPRKKITVHEYWGYYDINDDGIVESIVCTWVDNVIIRLEENPLPGQEIPFVRAVYTRIPFSIYGEALPALTEKAQRIDSVLHRGIFDDLRIANNGQVGTKKGFTDPLNLKKMKQGYDFEYNTTMADVYKAQYIGISNSIFTLLDKNMESSEALTGVKSFNEGIGGNSLGSTATSVNAITNSAAKREMHIVRGIAETCIIPLLRRYIKYIKEFVSPEEIMRITDKPFVPSDKDSAYDIKINIESIETKSVKAQQTGFVLQTLAPNMPHEIQMQLLSRYMKLIGEPDIAEELLTYQPQPDPVQQQTIQLTLAKLQAEIENIKAKAQENMQDVRVKAAKAEVEQAKARALHSDSDLKDLDFLKKESGVDQENELQKELVKKINPTQEGGMNGQGTARMVQQSNQTQEPSIETTKE